MKATIYLFASAAAALAFQALGMPAVSQAQEVWTARGGSTTFSFDAEVMARLGLDIADIDSGVASFAEDHWAWVFTIDPKSAVTFTVVNGNIDEVLEGRIKHFGQMTITSRQGQRVLTDAVISPQEGGAFDRLYTADAVSRQGYAFMLDRVKAGFDRWSHTLTIHSGELYLSADWAEALGDRALAGQSLGKVTTYALAEWVGGDQPDLAFDSPVVPGSRTAGPDMTFCQLYGLYMPSGARLGDIVGLSVGTTSWNIGTADLQWFARPAENHPFIIMNLFRLKDDRFEQIGQSWIKHGFYALGNTQCGGTCTYEPGHSQGNWLGTGCTDTYSASLNASQGGLGPRYEVNPWTGAWTYPGSHLAQGSHSHNGIEHRIQVFDADLDPAQNPGATYYCESFYVCLDDVDAMNSAAWKEVAVASGSPGNPWTFSMSGSSVMPKIGFAIDAWVGARQTMLAEEVPPIEFVSPDGRCILAAKATDLGGGQWHYEYALLNIDMDRKVGSFSIPISPGTVVTNIGFHGARHHDEEVAGYSNTAWTGQVAGGAITWTTVDNPVRWGTLYNFRFDADVPPNVDDVTVTLGLFEPGAPAELTGLTIGPEQGPADCNGNNISDECDIDCGLPGCSVPGCGGSSDCNGNATPDECETDCNANGVPDDCDLVGGTSQDCDGNGVPDECDPDADGDAVPDGCDICPGYDDNVDTDGDLVPDGCDACPGFDDTADADGDLVPDGCDNCPNDYNPDQLDFDGDNIGDVCDPDCHPTLFEDHFETDLGWTVVNENVIGGAWERGDPAGNGLRGDPTDGYDGGGQCYLTENVSGNSDLDGGPTRLISPTLDLHFGSITLSYAYWWYFDDGEGTDSLTVEVSTNDGVDWTQIAVHNDVAYYGWRTNQILLDDFVTPTATTKIRFSAVDNPNNSIVEAAVDAVVLTAECFPDCNGNGVDDATDIAGGTSQDCNANGIPDECDIASGTSQDNNGNGVPDECDPLGDGIRGGLEWDKWWVVNGAPVPTGNHPLYPPAGQQSGSSTYRCKECHGWDYKGVNGAYGSGTHYTGIPGVFGSTMTPQEMFDIVKLDSGTVPNGHDFGAYGLSDTDIWDLVEFMRSLVIDTDTYIDGSALFLGDPVQGQVDYEFGGSVECIACHGFDGTAINFGTPTAPEWVGTVAVRNPWEMLHKTRIGQPGSPMPSWLAGGGTDQEAADIGAYAQATFPVDCLNAGHCDDGDPCNGVEQCVSGYCQPGAIECGVGCVDCNGNAIPDQCDPYVVVGDFDSDCDADLNDLATFALCFGGAGVTTPPPGCTTEDFTATDLDGDGDVDLNDFSTFADNYTG
jgi:thiosulfate dehydrogenase